MDKVGHLEKELFITISMSKQAYLGPKRTAFPPFNSTSNVLLQLLSVFFLLPQLIKTLRAESRNEIKKTQSLTSPVSLQGQSENIKAEGWNFHLANFPLKMMWGEKTDENVSVL